VSKSTVAKTKAFPSTGLKIWWSGKRQSSQ